MRKKYLSDRTKIQATCNIGAERETEKRKGETEKTDHDFDESKIFSVR